MRILHVGKFYPPVAGGMERFLKDLVDAQRAAGHEVAVLVHERKRGEGRDDPPWILRCPVWLARERTCVSSLRSCRVCADGAADCVPLSGIGMSTSL